MKNQIKKVLFNKNRIHQLLFFPNDITDDVTIHILQNGEDEDI